jgi:hypothetical protein
MKTMAKSMRYLFDQQKKLSRRARINGHELDMLIMKKWGFNFSETDDDPIIDTLDYGINSISFEEFCDRMDKYKSTRNEDGSFETIK